MYRIFTANSKTEKILQEYISLRNDIKEKLDKLKLEKEVKKKKKKR